MKNKGFTLVELLAVIVVLSIIALIGYSTVGNIISSSQDSSNKVTMKNYAKAVDQAVFLYEMNNSDSNLSELNANWLKENVKFEKATVECEYATYDKTSSLYGCKVNNSDKTYCYAGDTAVECNKDKLSKIYGNSTQNGTPTPTSPVEIESVGQKTKNLFNLTEDDFSKGTINGEGKLVKMTLKPNTVYTLSSNASKYDSSSTNIWFNGNSTNSNGVWENQPRSTTSDQNGEIYIVIRSVSINNIFENYWIQLEEGSTATSYEPYGYKVPITVSNGSDTKTTNIYLKEPLRKVGDTADYLDLVNKKVVRNIKEIVFDGLTTNNKIGRVTMHNNSVYYATVDGVGGIDGDKTALMTNHFKPLMAVSAGNSYITSNGATLVMVNTDQSLNTASLWNNWLNEQYTNGTPVVVDYVLSEQTEENIEVPSIPELSKGQKCEDFYKVNGTTLECGY